MNLTQQIWSLIAVCNAKKCTRSLPENFLTNLLQKMSYFFLEDSLQGSSLSALSAAFSSFLSLENPSISFDHIVNQLLKIVDNSVRPHVLASLSFCIAGLMSHASSDAMKDSVNRFLKEIGSADTRVQVVSLLSLGAIAKVADLSYIPHLDVEILKAFENPFESVRFAASISFGCLVSGNIQAYLPVLLDCLSKADENSDRFYLLLNSVKELISVNSKSLYGSVTLLTTALSSKTKTTNESVRLSLSECFGRLISVNPTNVLEILQRLVTSSDPFDRVVAMGALRFVTLLNWNSIKSVSIDFSTFFSCFRDPDLVRIHKSIP